LGGEAATVAEQEVQEEVCGFKFDWNDGLPAWKGTWPDRLSDDGLGTLLASEETMRWQHPRCGSRWDYFDPEAEMERDTWEPKFNPGPPFAIGSIVICDMVDWCNNKQMGLVTRADHPNYVVCLDDGRMVDTTVTNVVLFPSYADSNEEFAPYVEPTVFTELRSKMSQVGSYGVYIDYQNTALNSIADAKAYAKAVKADDAGVPVELWNDRISLLGIRSEAMVAALGAFRELGHSDLEILGVIGVALVAFRKLGWRWYMKVLLRDSVRFMREQHGVDWSIKPRVAREGSTELGRDQEAIIGILWHATRTDWFEYPAGSKVVHFRFPKLH
jgi:hypothetical protein